MVILSAPWVVPIEAPIIWDGSIAVKEGRIIDIGPRIEIAKRYPQSPEKSYSCVLMPGLVNAHMHLELSCLRNSVNPQPDWNFTDWIEALLALRAAKDHCREEIVESFSTALEDQRRAGVILIGDIGNEYYDELHRVQSDGCPKVLRMLEILGPNRGACRTGLEKLALLDDNIVATGHAPYSTAPELLVKIKQRCNRLQHIFSVHTAESLEEGEFLRTGGGNFRMFLERRKSWDGLFSFSQSGFAGTIDYFHQLGLLDEKTLLVHCVHVTDEELKLIKECGSRICLCPGSNRFLAVGSAPVEQMVLLELLPALGTDSPASNQATDLWREMQILVADHADLDHATVLAMATLGGAKALSYQADYGSFIVGKRADFLHVSSDALNSCRDDKQLVKELVSGGKPTEIEWV